MARLSEAEKQEFARLRALGKLPQPRLNALSPKAYVEFATFASRFVRQEKPVRFSGDKWRL